MALVVKDRVKETTTTTGTGDLTLAGAVDNFQTFNAALSDQDTTYYAIVDGENIEFEVGIGTFTSSGTTLSRDTILESSNAGSAVDLQAGEKEVFITYPAERSLFKDASDQFAATNVDYDNATSGLTASNVKNAIDELNDKKVDVGTLSSTLVYYPTDTASGISTYTRLVTSTTDTDYDTTAVDIATGVVTEDGFIAGVISDQGTIVGTPGLINIHTVGNIRKTAGNDNQNAGFYFEVYKYEADTTETLLTTSNSTENVNSASYVEFAADALLPVTATFTETDRVLIKYYADNVVGSPEYEFQFGGAQPIRTSVPVPVDVVPHSNDAEDILADTSNFDNALSGSDSTVQAALDTLDDLVVLNTGDTINGGLNVTGSVGIGTSSPNVPLHISNTIPTIFLEDSNTANTGRSITALVNDSGDFRIQTVSSDGTFVANDYLIDRDDSGANLHRWRIGASEALRIDSGGNVGIGTSSPDRSLHIVSSSPDPLIIQRSTDGNTAIRATDGTNTIYFGMPEGGGFAVDDDANLTAGPFLKIDSSGNVGIGTTTPSEKLQVAGNVVPSADATHDLGTPSLSWNNIYTNDLHLSNMKHDKGNDVDGTKGTWTIQEGEDDLFIINNRNGKKYRFALEEIE